MLAIRGFVESFRASGRIERFRSGTIEENREALQQIQPLLRDLERIDREARPIEEQYDPNAPDYGIGDADERRLDGMYEDAKRIFGEVYRIVDQYELDRDPLGSFDPVSNTVADAWTNA